MRKSNNCGHEFEDNAPSGGVTARVPSKVLPWIKSHLKILIPAVALFIVAIIMLSLIPTFIKASVNGIYYIYYPRTDTMSDSYYTLNTGKWMSSLDRSHGTYTVKGNIVTFRGWFLDMELEPDSATVENGVLRFIDKGVYVHGFVGVKENHKHKYGSWQDKDELTCTQDQTQIRTCACKKEEIKVVTETKGHQYKEESVFDFENHIFTCSVCNYTNSIKHTESCDTCVNLTEVTIPDSVTSIDDNAFHGYNNLTSITIPDSVTSIGSEAFYGCTNLTSVTISNGVTSIGDSAFYGCSSLTSVTIPNSVTSIGEYAFNGCDSLTSVTIGNGVTSIGDSAFYGCTKLTNINIPNGVKSIGNDAFSDCTSLTSVTIGNGVTSIGDRAFSGCYHLTSINIPISVTSIGDSVFNACANLTSIIIPNGVTSIGSSAFYGCSSLTSVTIPNSVTSIGRGAFWNCTRLTSVTIGNGVTSIGSLAFIGCINLTNINIPNSVTSIGSQAFYDCTSLTSIIIPNSVTSIEHEAFVNCRSLTIYCEAESKPSGWDNYWNSSNRPVVWGYKG